MQREAIAKQKNEELPQEAGDTSFSEETEKPQLFNIIAKDREQYKCILQALGKMKIQPDNCLEQIGAIAVTLSKNELDRLKKMVDPFYSEEDTTVEHPPMMYNANLAPFNDKWLSWLAIDTENSLRGKGTTIAIIDQPVTNKTLLSQENFKQIDLFGLSETVQGEHGNAIASILSANTENIQGTSPSAQLLSIPIVDGTETGSAFNLATAILTAVDNGAQLISISLCSDAYSHTLDTAIQYAAEHGAVIVAAAGNDGENKSVYPASCDNVISVAACDATGNAAFFSNSSQKVDICAPGMELSVASSDGTIQSFSGTSAATPCVAGVVANILTENPGMTAANAAELVQAYAIDNGAAGKDESYGAGLVNYERAATWNNESYADAAATGHFFNLEKATETAVPLEISAQNTGNTPIGTLTLEYSVNGKTETATFSNVQPGATVTTATDVPMEEMTKVNIISNVKTDIQEEHLDNNTKRISYSLAE